jgi:hypothetical protein
MTDYPAHHTPDLTSQTDGSTARLSSPKSELAEVLAALSADAANWRTLLAELTARGFAEMSLSDILVCFPDFHQLANAHTGATPPDTMDAAKCAFLDTLPDTDSLSFGATITLRPSPAHPGAITTSRRTKPADVRDFAEADTTLGMVNVGYTDDAVGRPTLAFTFAYTNDTYLLPIVDILSELIATIVARRPIWSRPHKPAKLM